MSSAPKNSCRWASWAKLWSEHSGKQVNGTYSWYSNPLNVPDVDFKQCMVVAIFQGKVWNSAGVKLVELVDGKDLTLRFDDLGFQTSGPDGGGVETQPFGMFVLPTSVKAIALEENVQGAINRPPKWKSRGKL